MRIKKVSQTTPVQAQITDGYSTSTTDGYSCNYVNSIIESGSNSNGKYIKYTDGTLICMRTNTYTNIDFHYQSGNMYFCPRLQLGSPAVEFYSVYGVYLTISSGWALVSGAKETTTTNLGVTQFFRGDYTAGIDLTVDIMAIGRWKA